MLLGIIDKTVFLTEKISAIRLSKLLKYTFKMMNSQTAKRQMESVICLIYIALGVRIFFFSAVFRSLNLLLFETQ